MYKDYRQAYLDIMRENHLEIPETMMVEGDFSEYVQEQVEYLLEKNEHIDAIVCANDDWRPKT